MGAHGGKGQHVDVIHEESDPAVDHQEVGATRMITAESAADKKTCVRRRMRRQFVVSQVDPIDGSRHAPGGHPMRRFGTTVSFRQAVVRALPDEQRLGGSVVDM